MATKSMIVYKRRLKVKKDYLKGLDIPTLALKFKVPESIIRSDLRTINKEYIAQVQKNPHILEKQAEYILKHLDQLKLVKERLWNLENTTKMDKDKITALKTILEELNHEARVLKLINVTKTINNYIHVDKVNVLVGRVIDVIKEFVPVDQQKYALERLKITQQKIIDIKPEKE